MLCAAGSLPCTEKRVLVAELDETSEICWPNSLNLQVGNLRPIKGKGGMGGQREHSRVKSKSLGIHSVRTGMQRA